VLVSMMLPPKVSRSTMAAQRRELAKVLVQPPKASLEAIATEFFSSPSEASGSRRACRAESIPGRGRCANGPPFAELVTALTRDHCHEPPPLGEWHSRCFNSR
jgi:hypothetical protein